jgi:hypothetical protein
VQDGTGRVEQTPPLLVRLLARDAHDHVAHAHLDLLGDERRGVPERLACSIADGTAAPTGRSSTRSTICCTGWPWTISMTFPEAVTSSTFSRNTLRVRVSSFITGSRHQTP